MFGGSWKREKWPIGLDVGRDSVKLLQLTSNAAGRRVAAAACVRLNHQGPTHGDAFHKAVSEAVAKAIAEGGFHGRQVVSALPASHIQCKNLRLPKMPPLEMAAAAQWEARERMALGGDPHSIQYFDAGEVRQGDETRQEVILLAAATGAIERHVDSLTAHGLEPMRVEVAPVALARVSLWSAGASGDAMRVVVDMGEGSTKVVVLRGDDVCFYKQIDIGSRAVHEAVAREANVSLADAQAVCEQLGASLETTEAAQTPVVEAVRGKIGELGREIALCLRYVSVTFRGARPDEAQLWGGAAAGGWLASLLSEASGITFVASDPFETAGVQGDPERVGEPAGRGVWAGALGLSLLCDDAAMKRGAA